MPDYGMFGSGQWVVIIGSDVIGLFPNDESAIAWASSIGESWLVTQLVSPEDYKKDQ